MDPISQATLGAVAAQASAQHKLGFRVLAAGAFAGAMPDLDVFVAGDYFNNLQVHRGITHSLFFAAVVGPPLGYLFFKIEQYRAKESIAGGRLKYWMLAMFLAILSHPLLDTLTPYGTQLLQPFRDQRFSIFAMPIVDPIYTFFLIASVILAWQFRDRLKVHLVGVGCLLISCSYLAFSWYLNVGAREEAERQLQAQGIVDAQVESFPTIFQIHYRRVVARTPDEDRVGYLSMWRPCKIDWGVANRAQTSFDPVSKLREVSIFEWFAMGWLHKTVTEVDGETVYQFADLRYGLDTNPKDSFFTLNVFDTDQGYRWSTESLVSNSDQLNERFQNLFQSAYPASCS